MQGLVSLGRRRALDALVLGLSLAAVVETVGGRHGLAAAILAPLAPLPLIGRSRFPFGGPVATLALVVMMAAVAAEAVEDQITIFFTVLLTAWLVAAYNDRRHAIAGLFLLLTTVWVVTTRFREDDAGDYVWATLIFGAIWLTGFVFNRRIEHGRVLEERARFAEEARAEEGLRAVAEERARIARELHDVIGHSVSVMTVQASAVRRLLRPEQEKEREALLTVEQTGREALAEMRRMVGVLRRPEDAPALAPQPSLEHLDKLIQHAREAGLPVDLHVEGEPRQLPAGVDLTAYRLVQEGLTNALKHADARHAEVRVRYGEREVELEIVDDGAGVGAATDGGHGLVGMRERVSVYGGELQALVRAGFRMILEAEADIEVVGDAANGVEAVERTRELRPDVVLMDVRMPELDGIEATRRLVEDTEIEAKIVMLTTFDMDEYVYEALRAGASGFLLKDVPPEQLITGIRAVASGDALLSPSVTRRVIEEFVRRPPDSVRTAPPALQELTGRELEVLCLIARGLSNGEIAKQLFVSDATVKTHVARILMKLGLRDRVQAVVFAYESGLVQPGGSCRSSTK